MKKLAIHLVEDEIIIAMDMEDILNELGHSVVDISASYEEVMRKLPNDKADLYLVDIKLKGDRSGIQIAEVLRSNNIPHVFVSSQSDQDILERAKQTKPAGFICKPFDPANVSSALDNMYS